MKNDRGLSLPEILIAIVFANLLAATAIPRYITMQNRAREGQVKSNMHMLQIAVEQFAVEMGALEGEVRYPFAADAATVTAMLPGGSTPRNPFTGVSSVVVWGGAAATQGDLGYTVPANDQYVITGFGAADLLPFDLRNF